VNTDLTDVLAEGLNFSDGAGRVYAPRQVAAIAAATADGPLVEDVPCQTCGGTGTWPVYSGSEVVGQERCDDCHGTGTVRIVVHRADAALAERLRNRGPHRSLAELEADMDAAARIIGGEHG
jgi:RecJ-like exonuclease